MKLSSITRKLMVPAIGLFVIAGGAAAANAQNVNEEYREWQQAQRRAQEEYQDYLRTRSRRDYRDWQQAQRQAQQEYREYQMASRRGYNNGYYNNGYYNNGRVVYAPNTGRFYRVYRNGRYYQTDYRGAELLRQAVNVGYQQGYREGQIDRQRGSGYDYTDERTYRSGMYGYQSYVNGDLYRYYFQQGYQRGYEDGYYSTYRYGYRSGNSFNILGSVLNAILNLSQY